VCVRVFVCVSPVDMSCTRALVNHLVLGVFLGASSAVLGGHGVCVCSLVSLMSEQKCLLFDWNVRGLNSKARRKVVRDLV
jgi:hypothetical protein